MTMLDRMRRHRNWLKWSLALVCLAFVIFYIPDFLSESDDGSGGHQHGRRRRGPRNSRRGIPAHLSGATSGVSLGVRRQHERGASEAAWRGPADSAADGRRARGAGGGRTTEDARERRRGSSAHSGHSGISGERRLHRRGAVPATARLTESADELDANSKTGYAGRSSSTSCGPRSRNGCRSPTRRSRRSTGGETTRSSSPWRAS